MTEKYFSVSFGRFELFFIAYHVDLSLIGQQTLVSRILVLSLFFSPFYIKDKISTTTFSPVLFFWLF